MNYSIYHDLEINASMDEIFRAITQPDHLIKWWPLKCTGTPKENEEYNFYFSSEYDWYGKVIKIEKNKSFHIKMIKSDTDWDSTSFGFDLVPSKSKVRLMFWHKGWPALNAHFRKSSFSWAMLLNGLKNYVEHNEIVAFEDRA